MCSCKVKVRVLSSIQHPESYWDRGVPVNTLSVLLGYEKAQYLVIKYSLKYLCTIKNKGRQNENYKHFNKLFCENFGKYQ